MRVGTSSFNRRLWPYRRTQFYLRRKCLFYHHECCPSGDLGGIAGTVAYPQSSAVLEYVHFDRRKAGIKDSNYIHSCIWLMFPRHTCKKCNKKLRRKQKSWTAKSKLLVTRRAIGKSLVKYLISLIVLEFYIDRLDEFPWWKWLSIPLQFDVWQEWTLKYSY